MHRAILIAWFPWFLSLVAAVAGLWLVLRFSGARLIPAKLRNIHRCEAGSVQTLSFVFTLPVFIMLLMFIVQVADLMMAIGIVHYAAFAAARAASVWIAADVWIEPGVPWEAPNVLTYGSIKDRSSNPAEWLSNELNSPKPHYWKYAKILDAAALACTSISPARDTEYLKDQPPSVDTVSGAIKTMYPTLSPTLLNYPSIQRLIDKKLRYTAHGTNTRIVFTGIDRDCSQGPTYNPYPEHVVRDPATGNPVSIPFNPLEIGWEDPITVTVFHNFALMPGPGRFLATLLTSPDGTRDTVSGLVKPSTLESYQIDGTRYRMYQVIISASVTLSNEGLKSVMPYVQYQSEN